MITIHIIASDIFISKHLNRLMSVLSTFINEVDFNIIYHTSPPAYYDETDFRGKAFIKHEVDSSDYETEYHNKFKFLHNEYFDNPYDFDKSHEVFFEIIKKYRKHKYLGNKTIEDHHYVFLLTEVRGDARWLSAGDDKKNFYIHTNDWEYIINQADLNYINNIYEWCIINSIFQNLFYSLCNITYINAFENSHKVNQSCISDFARNKLDFIQSLRSGRICSKCMTKFLEKNNNNLTLLDTFRRIFNNISIQFETLPEDLIVFNEEQNLIINKDGIVVGSLMNNPTTIIKINQKQPFIIYLFLLKFQEDSFDIKKIKKLDGASYWNYIYKCYKFCQSLYNVIQEYETDQDVKNIFRKIFYTIDLKSRDRVIFDERLDKPKFKSSNGNLEDYTDVKSDFTKLIQIRNSIQNIINQENPLKDEIIRRAIEGRRSIKRGKRPNFDIFTPVIKSHAKWKIEFGRDKVKWGDDPSSQSLKNLWEESSVHLIN